MSLVDISIDGAVAVITLRHPPVNALSSAVAADFDAALDRASEADVRAVVVTGSPHFAAGADITEFTPALDGTSAESPATRFREVINRLESLPKPVIAAVRGFALGGGFELAMGCDFRFLADDSKVGQPEIKLGIIPGWGGTQRLTRLVGVGKARDIVYTGRFVEPAEALEIGLADEVYPPDDLLDETMERARELAAGPTAAIGFAKQAINEGLGLPLAEALEVERAAFDGVFATDDAREGVTAFLEKRPPEFTGR